MQDVLQLERLRAQRRINQVGEEQFALECILTRLTNEELGRIVLDLPEEAQDVVYSVLDDLEGV